MKVLHDENNKGELIFEQFYAKNSVEAMFKFLDEESTILEDLKIMKSLFSLSFIKAFFKLYKPYYIIYKRLKYQAFINQNKTKCIIKYFVS